MVPLQTATLKYPPFISKRKVHNIVIKKYHKKSTFEIVDPALVQSFVKICRKTRPLRE